MINRLKLSQQLQAFLIEDIGDRDVTSTAIFADDEQGEGVFRAKEDGVFSGELVLVEGFRCVDPRVTCELHVKDGQQIKSGEVIAKVTGPIRAILTGERVMLNVIQRMSGIATLTHQAVSRLNSSHTRICDTRKTTPGLRMFEKHAVRCGGGYNHRFGLYDGVMIKDNHIAHMGSIQTCVEKVRSELGHMVKMEVEIENLEQLLQAIEAEVDVIMFDNCSPDFLKEHLHLVPSHIKTEVSGGIKIEDLAQYQHTNIDYISLGALTHSSKALDISLDVTQR